jgi:hypothetical protein
VARNPNSWRAIAKIVNQRRLRFSAMNIVRLAQVSIVQRADIKERGGQLRCAIMLPENRPVTARKKIEISERPKW